MEKLRHRLRAERKHKMKQYRVIDEYVSMWGENDEIIVDSNEIERLSREWDVPVELLLEQVEELS
jgi:hypothetical protein